MEFEDKFSQEGTSPSGENGTMCFHQETRVAEERPYTPLKFYFVPKKNVVSEFHRGKLAFSECPGAREISTTLVNQDIEHLKTSGVSKVYSVLQEKELEKIGLARLPLLIADADIEHEHVPMGKWRQPDTSDVIDLVHKIRKEMSDEKFIIVHGAGGRGRSAMVCAAVLLSMGNSVKQSISAVQSARGKSVLNMFQRKFLERFLKDWDLQFEHVNGVM